MFGNKREYYPRQKNQVNIIQPNQGLSGLSMSSQFTVNEMGQSMSSYYGVGDSAKMKGPNSTADTQQYMTPHGSSLSNTSLPKGRDSLRRLNFRRDNNHNQKGGYL